MTSTTAPALRPDPLTGSWTVDPEKSSITFTTRAMWVVKVTGTLRATEGTGTVDTDGNVRGTLVFDAATVDTKNTKRDAHLRTADFFDVANHPVITFTVTGGHPAGPGQIQIEGTLAMHGITRDITALTTVVVDGDSATATTELDIDRSEWGLGWAKMGAGLANHVVVRAALVRVAADTNGVRAG